MEERQDTPVCLLTRSQAFFEAFVTSESLPCIEGNWIDHFHASLQPHATASVGAWLGRGPISHSVGVSTTLFFDHGEESYPVFTYPSHGPQGAGLHASKITRFLVADEQTTIFCLTAIATIPVAQEFFDKASREPLDPATEAVVYNGLSETRAVLDTLIGAYALYQYPLV